VQRLLEYERFQQVGKRLYERPLLGREIWSRGGVKALKGSVDPLIIVDERGLFAMIAMYRGALKKIKKNVHVVFAKAQSIASRILEIKDRLILGERVPFDRLIAESERTRTKSVVTFLSILELGKLGFVSLFQSETFGTIHIETKKKIERDVVTQVEEYERQETPEQIIQAALEVTGSVGPEQMTLGEEAQELESHTLAASDEEIDALEKEINDSETSLDLMNALEDAESATLEESITEDLHFASEHVEEALQNPSISETIHDLAQDGFTDLESAELADTAVPESLKLSGEVSDAMKFDELDVASQTSEEEIADLIVNVSQNYSGDPEPEAGV
jgi:segregation and condensation protein A